MRDLCVCSRLLLTFAAINEHNVIHPVTVVFVRVDQFWTRCKLVLFIFILAYSIVRIQ